MVVADVIDLDYGQSNPIVAGAASGEDEDDAPRPNTAAGRAAAMRPPRATPKRVINKAPEEPKKRRSRWWAPLIALVVLGLIAVGGFFGRQMIQNNYYVSADDARVTVLRGLPGNVFGYSLQDPARIACVTDEGDLTLVDPGNAQCRVMMVDDLQPAAREQVRAGLPSGSLDDASVQMARLAEQDLLPVCKVEEPEPAPTPAPVPGEPTPGAPVPGETPAPPSEPAPVEPAPGEAAPAPGEQTPENGGTETMAAPEPAPVPQVPGQNCRVGA